MDVSESRSCLQMSEGSNRGPDSGVWATPKRGWVYPSKASAATEWRNFPSLRANGSARTRGRMTGSAKQSIVPQAEAWIASSLALLAMTIGLEKPGRRAYLGAMTVHFPFQNTYAALPANFFARVAPTPVASPRLIKLNRPLALHLGLDPDLLDSPEGAEILSGKRLPDGAEPIAMAYAGHQFGHFVPQLGDGRAILLGEVIAREGVRYDIQLKGSGPTPFSRGGDGRAAVGPVLREYIVSEGMAALGVPTTRTLAAVTTGEQVMRETFLPGAVITRVAASHLRIGTFEYFAARRDTESIRTLANYATLRHYPEAAQAARPYRAFLDGVITRQARLVAHWMLLGFIHGVMNTDNTSISGETIDYGPCAFMEAFDPATVFSSIDRHGRYAYGNQPRIALWNLTRLAESLLPLLEQEAGSEAAAIESANQ